jgi:hypothetical protein
MPRDLRETAAATIAEELERALARKQSGCLAIVELDPTGDGVLLARSATLERPSQLASQLEALFAAADRHGRRPRLIVASAGISGTAPLTERQDLVAVLEELDGGVCSWVAAADWARIARTPIVAEEFVSELARRAVALYLGFDEPASQGLPTPRAYGFRESERTALLNLFAAVERQPAGWLNTLRNRKRRPPIFANGRVRSEGHNSPSDR